MSPEMIAWLDRNLNWNEKERTWSARSGRNWLLVIGENEDGWCIWEEDYSTQLELSGPPSVEDIQKIMELGRFGREA